MATIPEQQLPGMGTLPPQDMMAGAELPEDVEFEIENDEIVTKDEEKEKGLPMDAMTLSKFQDSFGTDKDNRRYTDWAWYVYDNYVKGNHFVKFNDITQMVEAVPTGQGSRFAINKIWTTLRAVRGFVTKYDPKWYIFPEDNSTSSISKAHYKQKVLDDRWVFGQLKPKSKQCVFQGLKYSVGITEVCWDSGEKDVTYEVLDPFDVYFGGPAFPYCTRVTKTVWKTHEEIESDPKYKARVGELSTTDTKFVSTLKQQFQDQTYGHQNLSENDKGTIVYETFYVTKDKNEKKGKINIATYTDTQFLRHIETDYDSLWDIFNIYRTDDNPGENYGEGWVKNLIPPQKMLDILESLTMDYHHTFAKGRYVVAENSGAKIITNENGTIIQHASGKRPMVENAPSMASSVDNQISRFNVYLEDIGGQHDASLGRLPTGASAGVAIEALQEGDANNLKDLVENYNIFLTQLAYSTLKMYSKRLKTTKVIQCDDKDKDGNPDFFAIIGDVDNAPTQIMFGGKMIPVVKIHNEEKVRVTVDSWLAYTRDAREQRVYKHYTAGLISRKAALDALQYSDVDKIIEDAIREEVVAKMIQEQQAPTPEQPTEAQPPETETAGAMSEGSGIPMPQM